MLVLSRKLNQAIMIGDDVRIVVVAVDRDQVKLGIDAPRAIAVHRSEIYDEIQRQNREAATSQLQVGASTQTPTAALLRPGPAKLPAAKRAKELKVQTPRADSSN
ncbi:MAG TPA: carbon storage regulator CsrA [Candidatus Baltobacteraceae bacterium]|jgi:carbon storage regulator